MEKTLAQEVRVDFARWDTITIDALRDFEMVCLGMI